jgi:hypothetical protein
VRGPGCPTATEVILFLKEERFGVDRVLARGQRTLRDGRVELRYACGLPREMTVYVQLGETRETRRRSAKVRLADCG